MFPNARTSILVVAAIAALLVPAAVSADEGGPKVFETPDAAAKAVIEAAANNDDAALKAIAGAAHADAILDGSDPAVAADRKEFAESAKEVLQWEDNEDGTKTMVVGKQEWPSPIPLKKVEGGWAFDFEAGKDEMLSRRIGRNELRAIRILRGYIDAQVQYASADRDGDQVREYAQKIKSSPGQKDGLYWPDVEGEEASPFGPFVTSIQEALDGRQMGDSVGGYVFRILTGQGSNAPGGRHSYVINGNMIAGFAMVATPADYGDSGIMTFLVSHHGKVYQKDLGANGRRFVQCCMRGYNPDNTWEEVQD